MSISAALGQGQAGHRAANEVSTFRLYLLRATYLLITVGLGLQFWADFFNSDHHWSLMTGVVRSMLTALSLLAILGLRYPLQMLPLLLFETVWKSIWLIGVALPLWQAQQIDAATQETIVACLMGIICPIVIPWSYVWAHYVRKPADRWK